MSVETGTYSKGLEGIIADETTISRIDGQKGRLFYRGYPIEELARFSDFEEVTYLLLYEKLPRQAELEEWRKRMRASRDIPEQIRAMIHGFPAGAHPMQLLQSVAAYLSATVEHTIQHSATCNCRQTLHQVVQTTSVVATYQRFSEGKGYIAPRLDLSHGANFLFMLRGKEPEEYEGRIMDACLVLHAEHEFNASTFTARVVASTMSTCYCSISAAMGALFGSLHGGANEKVLDMVEEIGGAEKVGAWMDKAIAEKRKIMGMGHREYKVKDPRSYAMEGFLKELSEKKGNGRHYEILKEIEKQFRVRMEEKGKPLYPNVDFFSGAVYTLLGIPKILFTPIFAMARVSGWLAHILEQREHGNRIYRPESLYKGPAERPYEPLSQRG
ncbi:MAG: citrate/2-methylcitrate synthase [Spirochaetia bacterium]|jgi:citrate synthase